MIFGVKLTGTLWTATFAQFGISALYPDKNNFSYRILQ